jgi:hypothetical protein
MRKRPITLIVLVALSLGLLLLVFLPGMYWDGAANVTFPMTVQDTVSAKPVSGARIRLLYRLGSSSNWLGANRNRPVPVTDAAGHAKVTWLFGAGGRSYLFGRTGSVGFRFWDMEVSAPGYETFLSPLSDYAGETRSIWRSMNIPITVELKPISAGTNSSPAS